MSRGVSRSELISNEREAPRDKPVASERYLKCWSVEANVRLHGTSPWHLLLNSRIWGSGERETPRGEPVVSQSLKLLAVSPAAVGGGDIGFAPLGTLP